MRSQTGLERSSVRVGRQLVQAIRILDDGHLLVQIEEHSGQPGQQHDVFDPEGRYLGVLRLSTPLEINANASAIADTLIGVTRDALDVNFVVKYAIRRGRGTD